jgi:hypothetical protein
MSGKPLHVQVAEALGWENCHERKGGILLPLPLLPGKGWSGWPPGVLPIVGSGYRTAPVYCYDTDWAATGPLIEKYKMGVWPADEDWLADTFTAKHPTIDGGTTRGRSPLEAVCKLILELSKAGKL